MPKGILEVQLIDAKGLSDTDAIGDIDPYVVIQYRSQEQKSSVARAQGTHPVWNETFKFVVHNPAGAVSSNQHKLILRIMDHDTFTADDFIGEASINVSDLISLGIENGISELRPTKYNVHPIRPNIPWRDSCCCQVYSRSRGRGERRTGRVERQLPPLIGLSGVGIC